MCNIFETLQNFISYLFVILIFTIRFSKSGANNLHLNDGSSIADVINGDIFFEITEPLELEYTYRIHPARNFGATFNASSSSKGIHLVPVQPLYGCTNLINVKEVTGNVVLVERGQCTFKMKSIIAEKAGAKAVIITDESIEFSEYVIEMIDDESLHETMIPVAYLLGKNGYMIRRTLQKLHKNYAIINIPVNLTFTPMNQIHQPPWLKW